MPWPRSSRALTTAPGPDIATTREIITALARIGGRDAAEFFSDVAGRPRRRSSPPTPCSPLRHARLRGLAPRARRPDQGDRALCLRYQPATPAGAPSTPWAACSSAARPAGVCRHPRALRQAAPGARHGGARPQPAPGSTPPGSIVNAAAGLLARALSDDDAGVRTYALRSLGSFKVPQYTGKVIPPAQRSASQRRHRGRHHTRRLGGHKAVEALVQTLDAKKGFAMRREALLALARADPTPLARRLPPLPARTTGASAPSPPRPPPSRSRSMARCRSSPTTIRAWWPRRCRPGTPSAPAEDTASSPKARPLLQSSDFMVRAGAAQALAARAPVPPMCRP